MLISYTHSCIVIFVSHSYTHSCILIHMLISYTHSCILIYVYSFIYSFVYTHSYAHFIYSFMYTHLCILIHIFIHVLISHTHSHTHSCILIYVYSFVYTHSYTHLHILIFRGINFIFDTRSLYSFKTKVLRVLFQLESPNSEHRKSRYDLDTQDYSMLKTETRIWLELGPTLSTFLGYIKSEFDDAYFWLFRCS